MGKICLSTLHYWKSERDIFSFLFPKTHFFTITPHAARAQLPHTCLDRVRLKIAASARPALQRIARCEIYKLPYIHQKKHCDFKKLKQKKTEYTGLDRFLLSFVGRLIRRRFRTSARARWPDQSGWWLSQFWQPL